MRTQPRFFSAVTRLSLGVAALVAVLFVAGCASNGSSSTPAAPNLSASVTSPGGMAPNQVGAQYTITLSNAAGAGATSGTVTLTDPPTNFTITGIVAGAGWTCPPPIPNSNGGFSCTNSNAVSGGQSFSPITVTGNVTGALGSTVSIPLQISGGGITTALTPTSSFLIANPPQITSFNPGANTITSGSSTTLTAAFSNGTASVDHGVGTVTTGTPVTVTPTATTTYTLTVTNAAGTSVTQTATVTVVPPPSISSFVPAAATITVGGSTTLTAVFSGGTGSVSNGVGSVTSGTPATVSPTATTTYTLTVTNLAGATVTQTTTVTVVPAPVITSFTPGAASITAGNPTTLTAVFSNGTGLVDHGVGTVGSGTPVTISPTATTTYTLTVTNLAGTTVTRTATVTVVPAPAITSFVPAAATITTGSSTTLTAVFSGGTGSVNNAVGTVSSGTPATISPASTTTYTLTVTNSLGATVTQNTTVTVVPAPLITSFIPGAASITAGNPTTLTAVLSNGSGSVNNGVGAVTTGTPVTVSPAATTTYTLTVTNLAGTTVTQTATVTVVPAPAITSFVPAASTITTGNPTTLTAVFSGGTGSVNNSVGAVSSGTPVTISPVSTTTYTLTVTNSLGATVTQNATVTVVPAPTITSFTPGQASIPGGTSTTLTAVFANGTGVVNNGVGTVTSGTAVNISPTATTTYTLTVTNAAGTAVTQMTTVTVIGPSITSFAPTATIITAGSSTTLTAVFSGGTGSINNGVGTVTTGTPVTISPAATTTYTLTVTPIAGSSVTATATVTVVSAPSITSFSPAAATVTAGGSTTLTAVFTNGGGVVNNGVGTVTTGTPVTVTPSATTTYTLTVTNAAGTFVTAQTTVTVVPPPSITSFTSAVGSITSGTSTTLTGVFSNGTGSVNNSVGTVTTGTPATVSPTTTTTYTLTVTNAAGTSVTQTATVTVVPAPSITSFAPAAGTITSGTSTTLTGVFSNGTGSVNNGVGAVTTGTPVTVSPTTTTTYTLTVTNSLGATATHNATVTVVPPPSITSFTPTASSISSGTSTTLTGVFSNGTGSVNNGVGAVTTGTPVTVSPTTTTTYTLTVTNLAGTSVTQNTTVTVTAPACTTNCSLSGTVSGPWISNLTITLTGPSPATTTTSVTSATNGAFNFATLASGTYNVSGSQGYNYSPTSIVVNSNLAGQTITATPQIASNTVSGTVSYSGTASSTVTTFINVYSSSCTQCSPVGGTSFLGTPSSGGMPYTVRGLRSDSSNYFVRAEIGTIDAAAPNASDPAGNSSTFALSSSQTGVNVTVNPQTPPTPSTPNALTVFPGNGAAFIVYDNPTNSNNDEIPASYTISYSTDGFTTSTSTPAIPAGNSNGIYVLAGLTNATSYQFKLTETNTSGSVTSAAGSGVTIGSVVANNTVSGTVTFTGGTPNASAPLYVGVFNQNLGVYFQRIAPGFSSGVAYSFSNVPNGNFQLFVVIDQNNNGVIDIGDITNFTTANGPPLIAINGNLSGKTIALGSISGAASATVGIGTYHNVYSFQSDQYGINLGTQMGVKLPVSMTLFSGPNVALPFDATTSQNNSGGNPIFNNSVIPNPGDAYQFLVTFSDGSTQVLSSSVTAVLNPPQSLAMNSPVAGTPLDPVLNWTAPSSTPVNTPYTYSVNLSGTTDNANWQYPHSDQSNGLLSTTTNVQFDVDGKATGLSSSPNLTAGNTYDWSVQLSDALGNRSSSTTTYLAPGGTLPAKLVFTQQPGNATAGSTMPTIQVTIEDASNNPVISATNTITLSISNNPGSGILGGTVSVSAVFGVATFSGLTINNPGTGYTLQASGATFTATSNAFNVAGTPTHLAFTVQPVTNEAPNTAIAPPLQVSIEDASNRVVTTATNLVTMAIGTNPASGTLSGTTSVSAAAGVATFSTLSINNAGTGYTLQASATGFTTITSIAFNVTSLPTTTVAFATGQQPAQVGGGTRNFSITIANDASGDLPTVTSFTLNGVACSPSTCGSFSSVTGTAGSGVYAMIYTPPSSLTAAISPTVTVSPSVAGPWFAGTFAFSVFPPGPIVTLNSSPVSGGVQPNSGAVNLIFTVLNDTVVGGVGEGVTIAPMTAFGYACQNLSPNSCGTLGTPSVSTNTAMSITTITVPYTPPTATPAAPYDRPLIFATSVADPTKSIARSFQILGFSGGATSALTGGAAVPLGPISFNDTSDLKSASWTITAGDISCIATPTSPCDTPSGKLTAISITTNGNNVTTTASYTPPATVPTGSGEANPSITMTETANSQVRPNASFNIVDGTCGTGSNFVLNGSYAFLLKGGTAGAGYNTIIGSFTANGNGVITGGLEDVNRSTGAQTGLSILSAGSSYSVGSDNRGCLTLANSGGGTQTFRFALGTISGSVATQGTIIRFDDTNGNGPRQTGILKLQNLTSISSSSFNGTYSFGLEGMDNAGGRVAVAGLTTANGAGAITNVTEDVNDNGSVVNIPSGSISGTYSLATNPTGGRGTFAVTFSGVTSNTVLYVISSSDAFIMSIDPTDANHPIVSGESKLRTTTVFPTAPANSTNYVLYVSGIDNSNGGSDTTLGQVQFGSSSNGTATAVTLDDNDNGIESAEQVQPGLAFNVAPSGRMTVSGAGNHPPIFYMVDMTQGFMVGTDGVVSSGYIEQQTGPLNNTSLPAHAFFGGGAPTAGGSYDVGAVTFDTSALTISGASDSSSQPNFGGALRPNSSISDNGAAIPYTFAANGTFTPTAPGQGTFAGALLAYIVSPTKIVFMQIGGSSSQNANSPELFVGQQ